MTVCMYVCMYVCMSLQVYVSNFVEQEALTLQSGEAPLVILSGLPTMKGIDVDFNTG